jgi:hypothetical protein
MLHVSWLCVLLCEAVLPAGSCCVLRVGYTSVLGTCCVRVGPCVTVTSAQFHAQEATGLPAAAVKQKLSRWLRAFTPGPVRGTDSSSSSGATGRKQSSWCMGEDVVSLATADLPL